MIILTKKTIANKIQNNNNDGAALWCAFIYSTDLNNSEYSRIECVTVGLDSDFDDTKASLSIQCFDYQDVCVKCCEIGINNKQDFINEIYDFVNRI